MRKMRALNLLLLLLLATSTLVAAPAAYAAPTPEIPPAITAWFDHAALPLILENESTGESLDDSGPDYRTATDVSTPVEVWTWSQEFISGQATDEPIVSTGEWVGVILSGDAVLGVVAATYTDGKTVEFASYGDDVRLGTDMRRVEKNEVVVSDPPSSTWVTLVGDTVTALDSDAAIELPRPLALTDYQQIVAKRYAQSIAESGQVHGPAVGGGGPNPNSASDPAPTWIGVAILAVGIGVLTIVLIRRRTASGV